MTSSHKKRSSHVRRKRKSSGRHVSCARISSTDIEHVFKSIVWDIRQVPGFATWLPEEHLNILHTPICAGSLKLLLPVGLSVKGRLAVYYQETVKGKYITIGAILKRIYRFYNVAHVHSDDLTYISIAESEFGSKMLQTYYTNPASIHSLRFIHFMGEGQNSRD